MERYVRLNPQGHRAVSYFFRNQKNLPTLQAWERDLVRWGKNAGLDTIGFGAKMTRKTWESWLATMYPSSFHYIYLSQGHTKMVSLNYYLMLPYENPDKVDMKFYTDGWI